VRFQSELQISKRITNKFGIYSALWQEYVCLYWRISGGNYTCKT